MRGEMWARYLLSLPERVLRSASALAGGLVRELGDITVPAALRRTRLYQSLVDSTLRFLIEQVGQVEDAYPSEGRLADDFALRRAAGNGVELIGILTFRASPVWVLAALADLSGAGRHLIQEIAASLKQEGLLDPDADFESVDQMLDGLEQSAGRAAEAINTPPLDVAELRQEWRAIRQQAASIPLPELPSPDLLSRNWEALQREAAIQRRSVFELSALIALSSLTALPGNVLWLSRCISLSARRTGHVMAEALLGHYERALDEIRREGFLAYWAREYRPYLRAAAAHFSPGRRTLTSRLWKRSELG
ncbi:MAG: hypothetical protein HY822_19200 [Acidobacteria bacterium]|nr:hypothetical protein [Acidobacteriota bacterium]